MNNIALDNHYNTLMKVRTQQVEATCLKPYLEYFESIQFKPYFTNNDIVTPILPMHINRNRNNEYEVGHTHPTPSFSNSTSRPTGKKTIWHCGTQ